MLSQPKHLHTQQVKRCLGLGSFDSVGGSTLNSDISGIPGGRRFWPAMAAAMAAKLKSGPMGEGRGGIPCPGICPPDINCASTAWLNAKSAKAASLEEPGPLEPCGMFGGGGRLPNKPPRNCFGSMPGTELPGMPAAM